MALVFALVIQNLFQDRTPRLSKYRFLVGSYPTGLEMYTPVGAEKVGIVAKGCELSVRYMP
jgi:hypothetical protein